MGDMLLREISFSIRPTHVFATAIIILTVFSPVVSADDVVLVDSGQTMGNCRTFSLALGDLDGDRDLDVFITCYISGSQVFTNDGDGVFSNSGQRLGGYGGHGVALGDLDGDGDLDAFVVFNDSNNPLDKVFLNDGTGIFTDSGQRLGANTDSGLTVWLCDIDGDNDLDALAGNSGGPNKIYLNEGGGGFTESGQLIGTASSRDMPPGDVDGDGDIDLYLNNSNARDQILLNDGNGHFSDSGQRLGPNSGHGYPRFSDVDNDGDLDIFFANAEHPGMIYINDGEGRFLDSGQALGQGTMHVELIDLDGNQTIDAITAHQLTGIRIWLNDGAGAFAAAIQNPTDLNVISLGSGDVDHDGDFDVLFGKIEGPGGNRMYFNNTAIPRPRYRMGTRRIQLP